MHATNTLKYFGNFIHLVKVFFLDKREETEVYNNQKTYQSNFLILLLGIRVLIHPIYCGGTSLYKQSLYWDLVPRIFRLLILPAVNDAARANII